VIREKDRVQRWEGNERRERSKKVFDQFVRFICERENLAFDSLIYLDETNTLDGTPCVQILCISSSRLIRSP